MSEISKQAPQAVYASEDQVLDHNGFDLETMNKTWEGKIKGKRIKGTKHNC
jgi:monofunctional biosynthetic peptidoglycan transglycosylase